MASSPRPPLFDPITIPIEAIAGEAALADDRQDAKWLRQRFAAPQVWQIEHGDEHLSRSHRQDLTPASVLIPIVLREQNLTVLLTQRTAHLHDHAGQISFPGGRAEPSDADAIETALREAEEEVGLLRQHVEVLGNLPDYYTISNYRVTPVVALIHPPFQLSADAGEVAQIFEVPFGFLMDGGNHQRRSMDLPNNQGRRGFYAMPYEEFFIWGATAAMLRNLYHFLRA